MSKEASHCSRITLDFASTLLSKVNPRLAGALELIFSTAGGSRSHRHSKPSLFLVTYPYGALLRGPRNICDMVGGVIPPCGLSHCPYCAQLLDVCSDSRPLYIVLSGAVEEFLEYTDSVFDLTSLKRAAPIRLLRPGDVLGGIEFLNDLTGYPRRQYQAPVRCAAAGARSVFVTMPLHDRRLMRQLWKLLPSHTLAALGLCDPSELGDACRRDNWVFLKLLSHAMSHSKIGGTPWETTVIIFANPWFRERIADGTNVRMEATKFVLEVFREAWNQSRGLRSQYIRQIALSDTAARLPYPFIAERIVQHILSIVRGDFPGFFPSLPNNELGPYTAIQRFIPETPLASVKAVQGRFPAIIQPMYLHADDDGDHACYLSLSSSTLLTPASDTRSYFELIGSINTLLSHIREHNSDLLGPITWEFCVSERQQQLRQRKRAHTAAIPISFVEESEQIMRDFAGQLELAKELYQCGSRTLFKQPPRSGFLSRFIRLSCKGSKNLTTK